MKRGGCVHLERVSNFCLLVSFICKTDRTNTDLVFFFCYSQDCTYAHGEEELQLTKLQDLHDAGLVDATTYRVQPCWTWVSTGSCPFGKRCASLHDPRLASPDAESWLPVTETQGNTLPSDINVEAGYQKRMQCIQTGHSLGQAVWERQVDTWSDLYKQVCNIQFYKQSDSPTAKTSSPTKSSTPSPSSWKKQKKHKTQAGLSSPQTIDKTMSFDPEHHTIPVPAIVQLQIALIMRASSVYQPQRAPHEWQYKFRPQHVIFDEHCMILQTRAFMSRKTADGSTYTVQEISVGQYDANDKRQLLVREIAFGPDADPSVRGVALWFRIRDEDVQSLTPQQAKRFRWKRSPGSSPRSPSPLATSLTMASSSHFEAMECFHMIRPHDDATAFGLVTDMMKHRLAVLHAERLPHMNLRYQELQRLNGVKQQLQYRFEQLQRYWTAWMWPITGKEITRKTPVPKVDQEYDCVEGKTISFSDGNTAIEGSAVVPIWEAFTKQDFGAERLEKNASADVRQGGSSLEQVCSMTPGWRYCAMGFWHFYLTNTFAIQLNLTIFGAPSPDIPPQKCRLSCFKELSKGHSLAVPGTNIPLPRLDYFDRNQALPPSPHHVVAYAKEQCWRSLLLQPDPETSSDWDMIREHFMKSRSKKVLSIIQKK